MIPKSRYVRQVVKIKDLKFDAANPNKMTEEQDKALSKSLSKFGYVYPVVVDKNTGLIADGEHRVTRLINDGVTELEVYMFDFKNDAERRLFRQTANKLHGMHDKELDLAEYDFIFKEGEFDELKELIALSNSEVNKFLDNQPKNGEDDFTPAVEPKYKLKQGDIYLLGKHRLMCGDATNPEHVDALMGGAIADMVFTDPPYGVSYTGTNNPNGKDWGEMKNDGLRGDALGGFLLASFKNMAKHTGKTPAIYVCYSSSNHTIFEEALNDAGFKVKQQLIWDKGMVLGHSDYHWTHEPILYCIKEGKNCTWFGDRAEQTMIRKDDDLSKLSKQELLDLLAQLREGSTIIKLKKDFAGFYIHPTQKPVSLPRKLIGNNSLEGFKVLELFGGSGSTLIACEQLINRQCFCMELDPKYASGIIERWEDFTKQTAKKVE